jgi:peptidoglycan/LPS O-acetylase OafA/YrhL
VGLAHTRAGKSENTGARADGGGHAMAVPSRAAARLSSRDAPPATPGGRGATSGLAYLGGVDGLRAIAVLAVIAFHGAIFHLDGGFLGVEVFFVISGYLITSLLIAEYRRTGQVSLRAFWLRRARRLLPALCALWVAVVAISATLVPDAFVATKADLPGAVFFVSNWWQIARHQSYFMAIERPPLLLHLWSLAIEEQFYLLWPIAFAYLCARVRGRWLACGAVAMAIASAAWMATLYDPGRDASAVYYRTDTRLSGLLFGMALAAIWRPGPGKDDHAGDRGERSVAGGRVLGVAGLLAFAVLAWAFVELSDSAPLVYRGGFLVVDVATAVLVAAAVHPSAWVGRVLGVAPLAWIGRRSYGLYLWHWPIFAITRPDLDIHMGGARLFALRLVLTLVVSELCYRFIETPLRQADLAAMFRALALGGSAVQRNRAWRAVGAVAVVAALTVGLLSGGPVRAAGGDSAAAGATGSWVLADSAPFKDGHHADRVVTPGSMAGPASPVVGRGIPVDPSWPKTLTLLTDSVTLGVKMSLPAALSDWKVEVVGRPALMVKQVVPEFLRGRTVGSVVVVGLAYNSLFEKNRRNYDRWAALWDREADTLLSDLGARGAKKVVWVTLREPSPEVVTDKGKSQYGLYAWFFPYVNERLHALVERHPEVGLADWMAVSNVPGVTYDLIHLSSGGVKLMTSTITAAVLGPS